MATTLGRHDPPESLHVLAGHDRALTGDTHLDRGLCDHVAVGAQFHEGAERLGMNQAVGAESEKNNGLPLSSR